MSEYQLRPFQQKIVDAIVPQIGKEKRLLISMPYGTGKGFVIAHIIKQYLQRQGRIYNEKILILTDRKDLSYSIMNIIRELFEDSGIIAEYTTQKEVSAPIFVCTTQYLTKEETYKTIPENAFSLIVFLECERIGLGKADSKIREVISRFHSATHLGIDSFVEKSSLYLGLPAIEYTLEEAISNHILVPIRVYDRSESKKQNLQKLLGNILAVDNNTLLFADEVYDFTPLIKSLLEVISLEEQKTLILCSSDTISWKLNDALNDFFGEEVSHILPSSKEENPAYFKYILDSKKPIIILSEISYLQGREINNIHNIVILKKIKSAAHWSFITQRFLSPYPGKEYVRIIDYVGTLLSSISQFIKPFNTPVILSLDEGEKGERKEKQPTTFFTRADIRFKDKNNLNGVIGVKELAEELAEIMLKMPCEHGRMIGIFGEWGRGKTFLMSETCKLLDEDPNIKRVDFHAWKYQQTPAIWAYLYEQFADSYYKEEKGWFGKIGRRLALNWKRLGSTRPLLFLASFLFSAIMVYLIPFPEKLKCLWQVVSFAGFSVVWGTLLLYLRYKNSARELFRQYYTRPSFTHLLGIQAEVQKELKILVNTWIKKEEEKIILFVDDIDRCSEERIIQIIDSLRVMLDDEELHKRLIIVTAIDERILKRAIHRKYYRMLKEAEESTPIHKLINEYIDKLFIAGIKLCELTSEEKDEFFIELTRTDRESEAITDNKEEEIVEIIEDKETFFDRSTRVLTPEEKENLKRRWAQETEIFPINQDTSREESETKKEKLSYLLTDQEFQILRSKLQLYRKITPRQIRIFYYRYLIAKNLLIKQYIKTGRENIWINSDYSPAFIELLVTFSQHEQSMNLTSQREEVCNTTENKFTIQLNDNPVEIECTDYKILLNVLDTVIGY